MNPSFLRPLGLAVAPLTVVSLGLAVVAGTTASGAAVEASPFAIASSALLLLALLGIAATGLAAVAAGRTLVAPGLAVLGAVLVAGGGWASLFVLPDLADRAPRLLSSGQLSGVTVGYVASYAILAIGWLATGIVLARARVVPVWLGVLLAVGGAATMVPAPEPLRLLILSVGVSLAAHRLAAPARTAVTA
ncbi:hypothetical protein [Petropleomorpha daqingensis]|uniref:Uncharacterized protein n=1 Tax=Petropleomorpha daqingensis TaxID=2026353 RepID=A0A853CCQ8_9ACTN|nr:hypothetical protein [Petropleomorpha daqingensis]NYJ05554.1 hypothetical protein [Petropleomorpha daqingensis]